MYKTDDKVCTTCNKKFPSDSFPRTGGQIGGRQRKCTTCYKAAMAANAAAIRYKPRF